MATHLAALLTGPGSPLSVTPVPTVSPGPTSLLIRATAFATNPIDYMRRDKGFYISSWPTRTGSDVAGEVVQVGSEVQWFKVGDRVAASTTYLMSGRLEEAGFQELVVVPEVAAVRIPGGSRDEDAVVLGLATSTAASGMYPEEYLGLALPSVSPKTNGKKLLVWGGSGSVGSSVVQLAVAGGYQVVVTASEKNHEYVVGLGKPLGGKVKVFDYKSSSIVGDLVAELGEDCVGAYDAIGSQDTQLQIATVLAALGGGKIATVLSPPEELLPATVTSKFVFGVSIFGPHKEIGQAVFGKFLTEALAQNKFLCAPKSEVVGKGLESLDEALRRHAAGVSAKKIVVTM